MTTLKNVAEQMQRYQAEVKPLERKRQELDEQLRKIQRQIENHQYPDSKLRSTKKIGNWLLLIEGHVTLAWHPGSDEHNGYVLVSFYNWLDEKQPVLSSDELKIFSQITHEDLDEFKKLNSLIEAWEKNGSEWPFPIIKEAEFEGLHDQYKRLRFRQDYSEADAPF